jgi:hypothetical protein
LKSPQTFPRHIRLTLPRPATKIIVHLKPF